MSDWHNIDCSCIHCHKPLQAKWNTSHGRSFVLSGAYPVLVRHSDGTTECHLIRQPEAYDIWTVNRELKRVEAAIAEEPEQ